ncbi:hypothetical protein RI129_011687 [Pyrocoelia pectoralis]|uniref:HAT C-terminal dimerisation domain-containing protein n=1 Tax=Pyrocoelia pectoralis TaxID=417401 RepID=A0AAN7UX06_9COLE
MLYVYLICVFAGLFTVNSATKYPNARKIKNQRNSIEFRQFVDSTPPSVQKNVKWFQSKKLQKEDSAINSAIKQLQVTKNYLLKCRSDDDFEQVSIDAAVMARELETEAKFEPDECRRRIHKRQFEYEAQDEAPQDAKQKFKVEFYYTILDMAIQSIEERFQQLEEHNILFGFLYDISNINKRTPADILTHFKHLETSLTHNANKDIDALQPYVAIRCASLYSTTKIGRLCTICCCFLENTYLLLTLPVSVASGERSFSNLKLIKSYLRSTMSQSRMVA